MKYRIKEVIEQGTTPIYYPQYKKFIFWKDFYKVSYVGLFAYVTFNSLTEARNFIACQKGSNIITTPRIVYFTDL
jgi:hypothetical protein